MSITLKKPGISLRQRALHFALSPVNKLLHHIECALADGGDTPLQQRPIFIIGAPRSGSTLIYQVLINYFDFGYFSNFHCLFFGAPSLVENFVSPAKWLKSEYRSEMGLTKGWGAPSECGEFWYRFFRRRPQYVSMNDVEKSSLKKLRGAVRAFGKKVNRPILFKNMNCALRLEPTTFALPEALFLVTHRNLIDNAQSLLKVRKEVYGSYDQWWSMEPPNVDELKSLPAHQQVVWQIKEISTLVDKARQTFGADKYFDIRFEDFCADTRKAVNEIEQFLVSHGVSCPHRGQVPESFSAQTKLQIDEHLYEQLVKFAHDNA